MTIKPRPAPKQSGASGGFVLVGVIWFLACMSLVVAAAVLWIDRSREGIEMQRSALQETLEERSMLSRLIWMTATHRMTVAGLTTPESITSESGDMDPSILPVGGEIPMDGREYCLVNGRCVTLIDRASRLSLIGSEPSALNSLLLGFGVPPEDTPRMLVELAQYLRGVQSAATAVTQRTLRSPMEVFLLPSWKPWEELLTARGWNEYVTVGEAALNLNTAGGDVLGVAWRLPPGSVERLLELRRTQPILHAADLESLLGTYASAVPSEGWSRLPSSVVLIRSRPLAEGARYEYQLSFESTDLRLPPWQLLQRRTLAPHVSKVPVSDALHTTPGILAAPLVAGIGR